MSPKTLTNGCASKLAKRQSHSGAFQLSLHVHRHFTRTEIFGRSYLTQTQQTHYKPFSDLSDEVKKNH